MFRIATSLVVGLGVIGEERTNSGQPSAKPMADSSMVQARSAPKIIFDSDYAPDVDDLVAHAVLLRLEQLNECEIIGCIVSTSCAKAPGAMDAVNIWHGRGDLEIGTWKGFSLFSDCGASSDGDNWAGAIYDGDYARNIGLADTVPDGVTKYREWLAAADDGSITIVTVGMLTVVSALLNSGGDGIDARNGADLIAAKVDTLVVMGTNFSAAEFNMFHAPAAASNVAANWPTPIWWCPSPMGNGVFTGKWSGDDPVDSTHIVRFGLEAFNYVPGSNGNGRQSWDALTVILAVRGYVGRFNFQTGTMAINAATGHDSWTAHANGKHKRFANALSNAAYENEIEPLVFSPQSTCILGDLNGDGVVDVSDLLLLLRAWGPCSAGQPCPADLIGNGTVDVTDLLLLLGNWG